MSTFVNYRFAPKQSLEEREKLKKKNRWEKESDEDVDDEKKGLEGLLVKEGLDEIYEGETSKMKLERLKRKPFLSVSRASMMILTCISILAVDFFVFPRRFAKVENFGTSLVEFFFYYQRLKELIFLQNLL